MCSNERASERARRRHRSGSDRAPWARDLWSAPDATPGPVIGIHSASIIHQRAGWKLSLAEFVSLLAAHTANYRPDTCGLILIFGPPINESEITIQPIRGISVIASLNERSLNSSARPRGYLGSCVGGREARHLQY